MEPAEAFETDVDCEVFQILQGCCARNPPQRKADMKMNE